MDLAQIATNVAQAATPDWALIIASLFVAATSYLNAQTAKKTASDIAENTAITKEAAEAPVKLLEQIGHLDRRMKDSEATQDQILARLDRTEAQLTEIGKRLERYPILVAVAAAVGAVTALGGRALHAMVAKQEPGKAKPPQR